MTTTQIKRGNSLFASSKLKKIIVVVLTIIVCIFFARAIYNTTRFFSLMENLQMPRTLGADTWATETYLSDLKQVARFVLNAPTIDRRIMIVIYNYFMNRDRSIQGKYLERAVSLHLLQRLIFRVPQEYPSEKDHSFGAFLWHADKVPYQTENVSNMLWPFEYDHDRLTIIAPFGGLYSDYYDGIREYNYFSSQFNFRSIDELK